MTGPEDLDLGAFAFDAPLEPEPETMPDAGSQKGKTGMRKTKLRLDAPRSMSRKAERHAQRKALRREALTQVMPDLPEPGETIHIVSNGAIDYFDFIAHIVQRLEGPATLHASTWFISQENTEALFRMIDSGRIEAATLITDSVGFLRLRPIYEMLHAGAEARPTMRYVTVPNHSKVMLLNDGETFIVAEGSANWTANPRIEQQAVTHDRGLWEFHAEWIEDIFRQKTAAEAK